MAGYKHIKHGSCSSSHTVARIRGNVVGAKMNLDG